MQVLGSLTIPLSHLLSTSDLSLDQWFQLDNSGSASRIYVKAVLRVNGSNAHALTLLNRPTGYRFKTETILSGQDSVCSDDNTGPVVG